MSALYRGVCDARGEWVAEQWYTRPGEWSAAQARSDNRRREEEAAQREEQTREPSPTR